MQENEIVLYQQNDAIRLEVRLEEETVWLNRNQMAILLPLMQNAEMQKCRKWAYKNVLLVIDGEGVKGSNDAYL